MNTQEEALQYLRDNGIAMPYDPLRGAYLIHDLHPVLKLIQRLTSKNPYVARQGAKTTICAGNADLKIAYVGDYPGKPHVWLNNKYLNEDQVFLLLDLFNVTGGNELSRLLDLIGAKRKNEEHEPWIGNLHIVSISYDK